MKNKKILKWVFITICVIVMAIPTGIYLYVRRSLPKIDGTLKLSILEKQVVVNRDQYGVAAITASNQRDLFKAQGFIQAQDRLFQMDLARRQASGRLAEVVGEKAVDNDKKFLVFSLRKAAEASYPLYSNEAKQVLQDFADGVNAYIAYAIKENRLPYEFHLLGYQPEKWTPIDSLTIGKYMAYDLGGHWSYQAFNNHILNTFGKEALQQMIPSAVAKDQDFNEIATLNTKTAVVMDHALASIETPHPNNGSNNWVVAGTKTKSGKPLLADDPHLSLSTPSIWYQMVLKANDYHVSGVIFAGIPGIILGHNENVAWGVTNYGPDVQDLYIEKQNPANPYQFELDGTYYDAEVKKYEIKIKNKPSQPFEVVYTKNGPLMNEVLKTMKPNHPFSMRWTALDATKELEAILAINQASNWEEFEKALTEFKAPAQNFVFADKKGTIAFKSNGNIPIRKKGKAILPVPGYLSEYRWEGYVPFDELAKSINPESGYLASANTNTIPIPYHISHIFAQPFRKMRIDEVLANKQDLTKEEMQQLQMDVKNLYAEAYLEKMLLNTSNMDERYKQVLTTWSKVDDKNEVAPLLFHEWMIQIRTHLFSSVFSKEAFQFMPYKESYGDELLVQALNGQDHFIVAKLGGLNQILTKSFENTIAVLTKKYGKQLEDWKWGKNHRLLFQHPIGKASKLLDRFLTPKPVEISGAHVSVQAAKQNEQGFVDHGASWRYVYDFGDETGYHIVGPGQSGHLMSPYYKNQVQNWADGKYNAVSLKTFHQKHTLTLTP